ncbi:RNA polymerase sigma factor [Dongia sedimenti]|uniref:Sigma-70 family RNA polymerase sigma factor n=1 Tax=Dongia sedimenti TaxID=3064282 RepID=A0ABU0YGP0_9PROT|nr:sigma-70 family RNA polymerase sigma factor [Rhodospirillaceae bacterium R-7]
MDDIGILVGPLIPPLRRYARALLRDRAAADDLVQDCLERALSRWHQRRAEGSTRTWLFTILHNLALNRMRTIARRGPHVAVEDAMLVGPANQEDALRHRDLLRALETLTEEHRSVLLLVSVEDLSYAETAKVLDIPVGTVMSRVSRARERLAAALDGQPAMRESHLRRVK